MWPKGWGEGGVFRALIFRVPIGLMALTVTACGVLPASAPAAATHPQDPPRFASILAALASDQGVAGNDLAAEAQDISYGDASPASQRCYILANNVRYDVDTRLDHGARSSTSDDAAGLQAQLDAKWQELVNLQLYNQEFGNNGVAPFNGAWATAAISAMMGTMTSTAATANTTIATVNGDVAAGYRQYRLAWSQWDCPMSKLLQGPPQLPMVTVRSLPKPGDP